MDIDPAFKLSGSEQSIGLDDSLIFGASDPYLNVGVARRFHELFPTSELFLVPSAYHYVQIDEPEEVARLILSTPLADPA